MTFSGFEIAVPWQMRLFRMAGWMTGSYPETGLGEINGSLPEADFWPASLKVCSGA